MLKPGLERYDSPIVMVNELFQDEEWGVTARFCSPKDIAESEGELTEKDIGWSASITFPNFDDMDLDEIFASPEAAIDFAIARIQSGTLTAPASDLFPMDDDAAPFGRYNSII